MFRVNDKKTINPIDAEKLFKEKNYILIAASNNSIYKLSQINFGGAKDYAFISLNGHVWLNGNAYSITKLINDFIDNFHDQEVLVFETEKEYKKWLFNN